MKHVSVLFVSLLVVLCLAGCGSSNTVSVDTDVVAQETVLDTGMTVEEIMTELCGDEYIAAATAGPDGSALVTYSGKALADLSVEEGSAVKLTLQYTEGEDSILVGCAYGDSSADDAEGAQAVFEELYADIDSGSGSTNECSWISSARGNKTT